MKEKSKKKSEQNSFLQLRADTIAVCSLVEPGSNTTPAFIEGTVYYKLVH